MLFYMVPFFISSDIQYPEKICFSDPLVTPPFKFLPTDTSLYDIVF